MPGKLVSITLLLPQGGLNGYANSCHGLVVLYEKMLYKSYCNRDCIMERTIRALVALVVGVVFLIPPPPA